MLLDIVPYDNTDSLVLEVHKHHNLLQNYIVPNAFASLVRAKHFVAQELAKEGVFRSLFEVHHQVLEVKLTHAKKLF